MNLPPYPLHHHSFLIAFTILMAHRSPSRTLRIAPARNKKDELYNAIIDWVEEGLAWSPSIELDRTLCVDFVMCPLSEVPL